MTPKALLEIVIALPVLSPESVAARRPAYANQLQASVNLAFSSALASVGLTIPAIVHLSRLQRSAGRPG